MLVDLISTGPVHAAGSLLLAHGAGVDSQSPFMQAMADGLAKLNWRVHRFDFPYMARRRLTGQKTLPDRPDVLLKAFKEAVDELDQGHPLVKTK